MKKDSYNLLFIDYQNEVVTKINDLLCVEREFCHKNHKKE
jgi:hypothetical protein